MVGRHRAPRVSTEFVAQSETPRRHLMQARTSPIYPCESTTVPFLCFPFNAKHHLLTPPHKFSGLQLPGVCVEEGQKRVRIGAGVCTRGGAGSLREGAEGPRDSAETGCDQPALPPPGLLVFVVDFFFSAGCLCTALALARCLDGLPLCFVCFGFSPKSCQRVLAIQRRASAIQRAP